jgi:branched-chain amino acid transport system substrate-binding protein
MNSKKWLFFLLVSCVVMITACSTGNETKPASNTDKGDTPSSEESSGEPIKIGVVSSLSGAYSGIGKEMVDGIQTAVDEVNGNGGLLGGRKVELVIEDDELKADVAIRKAEKMVLDQEIDLFMGSVSSGVTLALSGNMPKWDSLLINTIAKSMALTTTEKNDHFFRMTHNDNQDVLTLKDWMNQGDLPYEKFYFVGADYEWGHDLVSEMETIVKDAGGEVIGEEFTPLGTPDFSTALTNARSKKPDVIFAAYAGGDGANFLSQVESLGIVAEGIDVIIVPMGDSLATTNPKLTSGVFGPVNYHHSLDFPKNKSFVEKFESEYDYLPTNFSGESYDGAWMLFEAIEKSGSTAPSDIIKVLESDFTFNGAMGELNVDPESHQVIHPNYIGEFIKDPKTGKAGIQIIHTTPADKSNPK